MQTNNIGCMIKNIIKSSVIISPKEATNKKVEWISSDPEIATVNNGRIKGITAGTCDIICRALDGYGAEAVCHVTVTEKD